MENGEPPTIVLLLKAAADLVEKILCELCPAAVSPNVLLTPPETQTLP